MHNKPLQPDGQQELLLESLSNPSYSCAMKPWIIYTTLALMFYGVAEYYSKIYADTYSKPKLFLAMILYIITTVLWFPSLKNNNHLIVMTTIWTLGYVIVGCAVGILAFQEHLSLPQWIGRLMIIP